MPDSCTCGALLPEDARFCHKCGKPQREEPVFSETAEEAMATPEPVAATPEPAVPAQIIPTSINLSNRYAVRAGLFAGIAAFFVAQLLGLFAVFGLGAGGIFAVFLYGRATGQNLSVSGGAKLGWITGIFLFVLLLLSFTAQVALQPTYLEDMRQGIAKLYAMPEAEVRQMVDMLFTPLGIASMLIGMFLTSILPPIVGGAVGAKLLGRR